MDYRLLIPAAAAAALAAGCYAPSPSDCAYSCTSAGECPGDLTCLAGVCRLPGQTGACLPDDDETYSEVGTFSPIDQVDLLFVIDNSSSMMPYQQRLAEAMPALESRLAALSDRTTLDLHAGAITTDLGSVADVGIPGCTASGHAGKLRVPTGTTFTGGASFASALFDRGAALQQNYSGDLAAVLGALFDVGSAGCGLEMPLTAIERALAAGANPEFLRSEGALALVILSTEDDCSSSVLDPFRAGPGTDPFVCYERGVQCTSPIAPRTAGTHLGCAPRTEGPALDLVGDHVAFVRGLRADPSQISVAAIVPPDSPVVVNYDTSTGRYLLGASCAPAPAQQGQPAIRTLAFAEQFRNQQIEVCRSSYNELQLLDIAVQPRCLDGAIADATGAQPEPRCIVEDLAGTTATALPRCNGGNAPCYELARDAVSCPDTPSKLRLDLHRSTRPAPGTTVRARCVLP